MYPCVRYDQSQKGECEGDYLCIIDEDDGSFLLNVRASYEQVYIAILGSQPCGAAHLRTITRTKHNCS